MPSPINAPPLLQPVEGVVVGGTMVCGAPLTRWYGRKTKSQRGKDKVGIVLCRHCTYCTQHMGKAWRRLVTARGKERDQCARADREGSIARVHIMQ